MIPPRTKSKEVDNRYGLASRKKTKTKLREGKEVGSNETIAKKLWTSPKLFPLRLTLTIYWKRTQPAYEIYIFGLERH